MKTINIGSKEVIHFIGIGGIGMSGLAQIMKVMGFKIQGSDINTNRNIENCKNLKIKVYIGHKKHNLNKATIIVKSTAIKKNNPEIIQAIKNKLPIYDRAEMLANVISLKKNIIITGSHGKTTTTSLIGKILTEAKLDPTIINGGVINSLKNNAKLGKGEWSTVEADESDGSFLKLPINYSIVTNLDYEHSDYYKSFKNLENSFVKFINKTPPIGKVALCIDDKNILRIIKKIDIKNYITYGFSSKSDYQILNLKLNYNHSRFDLRIKNFKGKKVLIKNFKLNLMGRHNISNAAGAITISLNLGINPNIIKKALDNYSGVQRRMTKVFTKNLNDYYDDYAHHPTEIMSVLKSVKDVSGEKKIISIFQPHRFSRVLSLEKEFAKSFKYADTVILCPIYPAGERKDKKYDELKFARSIAKLSKVNVVIVNDKKQILRYLSRNIYSDEIIIGMGAGSISQWIRDLKNKL